MDIYRMARRMDDAMILERDKNKPSLYQLYKLAQKKGIFDAFSSKFSSSKSCSAQ
jgi:hypothetical protein